jgi:hypothetical protein
MKGNYVNEKGDRSMFRVPEGYFETLGIQIDRQIDAYEAEKAHPMHTEIAPRSGWMLTMQRARPILYMAAMLTLMLFSISSLVRNTSGKNKLFTKETNKEQPIPTAEDYLISNMGTYAISRYYVESGSQN